MPRALLLVVMLSAAGIAPAPAGAASPLIWSPPLSVDHSGRSPSAISCPSESLCVAVDLGGSALASADPSTTVPYWASTAIDPGRELTSVSCPSTALCVAVDAAGGVLTSGDPVRGSWTNVGDVDEGRRLTGVACPSASLCIAVDQAGNVLASTNPVGGSWAHVAHAGSALTAVSCASTSLCVAIDEAGGALASTQPAKSAWSTRAIDSEPPLTAVSCAPSGVCVAVDGKGDALASVDPGAETPTWSATAIASGPLGAVACAASGLCVALDGAGTAHASDDPTAPAPSWSASTAAAGVTGISCLPGGFCAAVDAAGGALTARTPAPAVATAPPAEVAQTTATLTGTVDPHDALLGACWFEYGASISYGQVVPCASAPSAGAGTQTVTAQLTGLSPNTAYHYRLLATSPAGTGFGDDDAFTTAVSTQTLLVYPNPSIAGTPAKGERLTCRPGTPTGASARLSYAWLRDLVAIPDASGSSYVVKGADTGHHLQCQVTATDAGGSATARSAFVTIPVEAVPASVGETVVGKAAFKNGKIAVPVACSPYASGGCQIALRLTISETLSGGRVVAIAARSRRGVHGNAASLRHLTVTLASARLSLAAGAHRTLTVALDQTGRRLLASRRRLSALLLVSGTVIGVIEARLAQQFVVLGASSRNASTHAARRR